MVSRTQSYWSVSFEESLKEFLTRRDNLLKSDVPRQTIQHFFSESSLCAAGGGRHKGGYHWMALGSRIGHRSCSEGAGWSRAEGEWGQTLEPY